MTEQVSLSYTKIISDAVERLYNCVRVNIQTGWLFTPEDLAIPDITPDIVRGWQPVQLNDKGYFAWSRGRHGRWLAQIVTIPQDLTGYQLRGLIARVALVWWADAAQVYINGKLAAEGDLFDFAPRVLLTKDAVPGTEFLVAVRLVSPSHDIGALMRSQLIFESGHPQNLEPSFIADEIGVLQKYLTTFAPEKLADLGNIIAGFDLDPVSGFFPQTLRELRNCLIPLKVDACNAKIYLVGHAHLDMAWLWPVSETWRAAENTFSSVLNLQQDFADLIFSHSTPALYAWIEENRPQLFTQIQAQVTAGKWEVTGGFWVEPELNLIAGESIVRQLLYGQRYTQAKFGRMATVAWLPDTFGFCWTLPQFMQQGGIEFFVTQKLRWNDTTEFPYGLFTWKSPDGSEITSYMSAPIGEGIEPQKLASYSCQWQQQTGIGDALWLPGVGDHGGGPTRDMLEIAARWENSPLFPKLEFISVENYLRQISKSQDNSYPVWNDEIYLEFHRGCYTTHGDQKRYNRRCETQLFTAELFATLAQILDDGNYPHNEIETAWKKLLFNQFHDILPGSSIPQVYADAQPEWAEIERIGTQILNTALERICDRIPLPTPPITDATPIFVFNSLNWSRSQVINIDINVDIPQYLNHPCIYNCQGEAVPQQLIKPDKISFFASDIPSIGYKIFWLAAGENVSTNKSTPKEFILENPYLRVTIDENTGNIASLFDKVNDKEILSAPGNQLQAFQDTRQYWDAWNIDPNYQDHPLPPPQLNSITWKAWGSVENTIRVIRQIGGSEFCQDYILETHSPILKIHTTVHWQENHVLVKAAFPLTINNNFATYEIPCGTIQRTTTPQTPQEKAKWEVPALRWADISTNKDRINYGVSLLNDCKYGYDATPNQLRLTLLRGPEWPNPQADRGFHEFTYAIYPHTHSWEQANTVQYGYELNTPLQVVVGSRKNSRNSISTNSTSRKISASQTSPTSDSHSFIQLTHQATDTANPNLIIMALKPGEDQANQFILRCYECNGTSTNLKIINHLGLTLNQTVNILESPLTATQFSSEQQTVTVEPGKVYNLELKFAKKPVNGWQSTANC